MNKIISSLLLIIAITFGACSKLDELTQFNMNYDQSVVIPSSTGINLPFNVYSPETQTDSESKFEVNDTRKDLIEEIKLTNLNITLTNPSNSDLSFLNDIEVYINAEGLQEIKIASKNDISDNVGNFISLETTEENLQEYIKKDQFNLRVNTVTDEVITSDHTLKISTEFFVDAKIAGI